MIWTSLFAQWSYGKHRDTVDDWKGSVVLHKGQPTVPNPAGNWAPSAVAVASLNIDRMTFNWSIHQRGLFCRKDSADLGQFHLSESTLETLNSQTILSDDKKFIHLKYLFNTKTKEDNFCQVLSMIRSILHAVLLCSVLRGQNDGYESLSCFPAHSPISILMREPEQILVPLCSRHTARCVCSVETTSPLNHHVALSSQRHFTSNKWQWQLEHGAKTWLLPVIWVPVAFLWLGKPFWSVGPMTSFV